MEVERTMDEADATQVGRNGASAILIWTEGARGHASENNLKAWPAGPSLAGA